ncbi:MAG TPA: SCO family protein [Opitutaceae bacterium]
MKTSLLLTLVLSAVAPLLGADDKPACCRVEAASDDSVAAAELPPRSLYQLEAVWTDDAGREAPLAALRGSPVVLTMFFARCEYACPVLVHDMRKLRDSLPAELRDRARFVLVTFDVARDTPEALRAFRTAQALDAQWTLLRGSPAATQTLAMLLGVRFREEANGQFGHSNLITILNADGEVVHQRTGLRDGLDAAAQAIVAAAK